MTTYFIGVDVGSGSARAGVFDIFGKKLADAVYETKTFKPLDLFVENLQMTFGIVFVKQ